VLAAVAVMAFGGKARSVPAGGLRGAWLGLLAGLGIAAALGSGAYVPVYAGGFIGATVILCAAVAALFAFLKRRRMRQADEQWRRLQ